MLAVNVYQLLSSECVNRRSFSQKNDINIRLISVGKRDAFVLRLNSTVD